MSLQVASGAVARKVPKLVKQGVEGRSKHVTVFVGCEKCVSCSNKLAGGWGLYCSVAANLRPHSYLSISASTGELLQHKRAAIVKCCSLSSLVCQRFCTVSNTCRCSLLRRHSISADRAQSKAITLFDILPLYVDVEWARDGTIP